MRRRLPQTRQIRNPASVLRVSRFNNVYTTRIKSSRSLSPCPRRSIDIDRPLNEAAADKIRDYRADYKTRTPNAIAFMPAVASTSGRLHCESCELVRILFLQAHPETAFSLQEFSVRNPTSSTTVAQRSTPTSNLKSATSSPRLQHCVSI